MAIDKALTPSPWTIQMDYPKILNGLPENGLPLKILFRMSTIERTAIYILTLHVPCLFLSARPLAAILNNYTQWTTAECKKCRLKSNRLFEELEPGLRWFYFLQLICTFSYTRTMDHSRKEIIVPLSIPDKVQDLLFSFRESKALFAAFELGIFDLFTRLQDSTIGWRNCSKDDGRCRGYSTPCGIINHFTVICKHINVTWKGIEIWVRHPV